MKIPYSTCGRCHRPRYCSVCGVDLGHRALCHIPTTAHSASGMCAGDATVIVNVSNLLDINDYRAEDYVGRARPVAPLPGTRMRVRYRWQDSIDAGPQRRTQGVDFVVKMSSYRIAAVAYARAHQLDLDWHVEGPDFVFELRSRASLVG